MRRAAYHRVVLAAPPPLSDRDEVIALLRAWHADGPDTRYAPASLDIRSIVAIPVHRVAITRIAENRGTGSVPRTPTTRRVQTTLDPIDPWSIPELDLSDDSPVGRRIEKVLEGEPDRVSDCGRCAGEGRLRCGACGGSGYVGGGKHRRRCEACGGSGMVSCTSCGGLGAFAGPPIAWSVIAEGSLTRVVRPAGISDQAALDLDAALGRGLGALVLRENAWNGTLDGVGDARDGATVGGLSDQVRSLRDELAGTSAGRARGERIEIRRASVYTVTLGDGRSFQIWGPPAKVSPPDALDAPGRSLLRVVGLFAIGFVVALALMWLQRHR